MKQKKTNRVTLLLHWAGEQKIWLFLAVLLAMAGGLCIVVPYIEIYRLMDAAFGGTCTEELVVRVVAAVAAAVVLRFVLFGASGVVSHKGAYGALFKVRCMVAEHMAKVPLGALNERRTGDIKTVLNEDIEKLELFLAHNLPDLVCYLVGPVVVFAYLMTVNIPLALISPGAAGACGPGDGDYVPQYGRADGPGQPFHHRAELGHELSISVA